MIRRPLNIAIFFFFAGLLFIIVSNLLIQQFSGLTTSKGYSGLENSKDFLFVIVASVLIYVLLKKGNKQTKKSEKQYQQLFEDNPQPMCIYTREDFRILAVNKAAIEKYGYSKEEFLNMTIKDLRPTEDIPLIEKIVEKSLGLNKIQDNLIFRHKKKSGEVFYVQITSHNTTYKGKSARLALALDIDEKYKADQHVLKLNEELALREKLFSSLVNSQTNFLIRINLEGKYSYVNPQFLQKMGFSIEELFGSHYTKTVIPEDWQKCAELEKECFLNPSKIFFTELKKIDKQGTVYCTEWEFIGITDDNGSVVEFQGVGRDITEKKLAELKLRDYTNRLQSIIENMPDGFCALDENKCFIQVNQAFERIFKIERKSALGKNILQVFPKATSFKYLERFRKTIDTGDSFQTEEFYENKWLKINISPFSKGACIFFNDVTYIKENEIKLKSALERYEVVAKATNDVVWDWNPQTNKIIWNRNVRTSMFYKQEEVGDNYDWWKEKLHPDDYNRVVHGIQKAIEEERAVWEDQYRFLCANNQYKYFLDRGYLIYNEEGKAIRMIGAMQDIHQHKLYQEEIRKLSEVARKTMNGVVITDNEGLAEWVNDGFTRITGYTLKEIVGKKPGHILQGKETDPATVRFIHDKLKLKTDFSAEIVNYRKDGSPHWIRMDISPIFEAGELVKFIGITTEITERKQFEEMLKKQNEQLKEIAWISSHDVRRPVASILGLISLYDKQNPVIGFNLEILTHLGTCAKELDAVIKKIVYKTHEVGETENSFDELDKS